MITAATNQKLKAAMKALEESNVDQELKTWWIYQVRAQKAKGLRASDFRAQLMTENIYRDIEQGDDR